MQKYMNYRTMEKRMKKEYLDVLELTRACITGTPANLSEEVDWQRVSNMLKKGKLYSVVYRTVVQQEKELQGAERIAAQAGFR